MAGSGEMQKHLFRLKFACKEMARNAKKCDKQERIDREKCKKAIKQNNLAVAKVYAENAIRQRNQSLHFLQMSARLDGVASRVQDAITMHSVTHSMAGITRTMDIALDSMNLEEISLLMDKFERQCETLDVQSTTVDSTMNQTLASVIPTEQVQGLMAQIAGEAGLELMTELPNEVTGTLGSGQKASTSQKENAKR